MLLASFAFSNQLCRVFEHCGPVVPLSQCFPCQGPRSDVVATYALVYLPEYVVGVFLPYALKNGRREALFIKGPLMNGESCRPCFESPLGRLAMYYPPSNPRWGPSSSVRTSQGRLLRCRCLLRVLEGARQVSVCPGLLVRLSPILPRHQLENSMLLVHV